jgi:hypothetical protein
VARGIARVCLFEFMDRFAEPVISTHLYASTLALVGCARPRDPLARNDGLRDFTTSLFENLVARRRRHYDGPPQPNWFDPVLSEQARTKPGGGQGARRRFDCHAGPRSGYLPSVSSFRFSSSFIFLTVGSWLDAPVV